MRVLLVALFMVLVPSLVGAQEQSAQRVDPALKREPVAQPRQKIGAKENQQSGAETAKRAPDYLPALNGIESAIRSLEAQQRAAQSQGRDQHDIRDLQAQEDMALWAERMFWATVGTIVVAVAGVIYVRNTLIVSRRIGQAQVRSYLNATGGSYEIWDDDLRIEVFISNVGASPAREVWAQCEATISLVDGSRFPLRTRRCSDIPAQGGGIIMGTLEASKDENCRRFFRYAERRLGFGIEGTIVWTDVFGIKNKQPFSLTSEYLRTEESIVIGSLRLRIIGDEADR